jgi:hypothetical protein
MALLSATEGTPERVWSLVSILAAHGGKMERQELVQWLNPLFRSANGEAEEKKTAVDATIQAALDLNLIDTSERGQVRLVYEGMIGKYDEFADDVHARLARLSDTDADAVIFEAFAWLAVQVEIEGSTLWVDDWSADEFADRADKALNLDAGERRFNKTKRAPWRRWLEFVGLSVPLPTGEDYPSVTKRLERELFEGGLPFDEEIVAGSLLDHIAHRLPYLDGGRLFARLCDRLGHRMAPQRLSRLLSSALRELDEDGRVTLIVRGDSRYNVELAPDQFSRTQSFGAAILNAKVSADA